MSFYEKSNQEKVKILDDIIKDLLQMSSKEQSNRYDRAINELGAIVREFKVRAFNENNE